MAWLGEGRPGDVEPAGAGQQLVGISERNAELARALPSRDISR